MINNAKFNLVSITKAVGAIGGFAFMVTTMAASADPIAIRIKPTNSYEPKTQQVKVGDTVEWVNEGGTHTVTPNDNQPEPFQGSPVLAAGQKYSVVISGSPRTINYHCRIHGLMMSGALVVAAP
jgi:plastocyanin